MPLQVPSTRVGCSQPQVPVVKVNESSGCLDALISKIWSCVQAVLNFLTCGCFSSSSKQESVGSPVDPSRVQQLSQQGKNVGGSDISSQTRLKEILASWQEAIEEYQTNYSANSLKTADSLVDTANSLIDEGANLQECDPNGALLKGLINSIREAGSIYGKVKSELKMVAMLLRGGVQFEKQDLKTVLSKAMKSGPFRESSVALFELFIKTRKEVIVECDRNQQLLATAAMQVNYAEDKADRELKILTMLLDAGLQIKGGDLKLILSIALQDPSKDHCRNLIMEFITKRREAVLECDTDSNLFRLANDQAKKTINDQAKADLEFIALNLNPGRSRQGW